MILVFIVAPVRVYREELARGLDRSADLRALGSAATGEEARDRVQSLGADVVLVDASTPAGVATARTIRQATPGAGLVALAAPEDDGTVVAYAEAGVAAFVAPDASLEELVVTARAVARGALPAHSPRIAAALLRRVADGARPPEHAVLAPLTSRERQIVALIDEGLSNKEIAARLCIELSTVKNHVHNLLEKLGARGRVEAAARVRAALSSAR
ncbi:MAG TPA: response regulator transcription factor [Solirubrobacteraceae bacterium]|nr:response regulator transcription factor [Solirubrobacteraceae bacterium]